MRIRNVLSEGGCIDLGNLLVALARVGHFHLMHQNGPRVRRTNLHRRHRPTLQNSRTRVFFGFYSCIRRCIGRMARRSQ